MPQGLITQCSRHLQRGQGWISTFTLLCLILLVIGCASKEERFSKYLINAEQYALQGDNNSALIELRSALQLFPNSADVNFRIAEITVQEGMIADGLFFYLETYRIDPHRLDAALKAAPLLYASDPARAQELISEVLEREPSSFEAYIRQTEMDLLKGDTKAALQHAMTAVQLGPAEARVHRILGLVHRSRIREKRLKNQPVDLALFEMALASLDKAQSLAPESWAVALDRAELFDKIPEKREEVTAAYQGAYALAQASGNPEAQLKVLDSAWKHSRYKKPKKRAKALPLLEWALATLTSDFPENAEGWKRLAGFERRAGRDPELIYIEYLKQRPQDIEAYGLYAAYLASQDRFDESIALIHEAEVKANNRLGALRLMVIHALNANNLELAQEAILEMKEAYPDEVDTHVAEARFLNARGRYKRAEELLFDLSGAEQDPDAQMVLARSLFKQEKLLPARIAIDRAIASGFESDGTARRLQAAILFSLEECRDALITFSKLRQIHLQLTPMETYQRADCYYETGASQLGRSTLVTLLESPDPPPEAAIAYLKREASKGKKRMERAEKYILAAYTKYPANVELLSVLVQGDIERGRPRVALQRIQEAFKITPRSPELHILYAQVFISMDNYEEAEKIATELFDNKPNHKGSIELLIVVSDHLGHLDQAITNIDAKASAGELRAPQLLLLGSLLSSQGRTRDAIRKYELALKADPENLTAMNDLSYLLASEGTNLERALELAKQAQSIADENPRIADTLGFVYARKGLTDAAVEQYRYAIDTAEKQGRPEAIYYQHLGELLQELGREEEAARQLEKAAELNKAEG